MAERVSNDFATTLASSLSIGASTLTVASGPPTTLTLGNFRIRIEDADSNGRPNGQNVEYLNVTAVGSPSTVWNVTRAAEDADRFPAVAHAAGSIVTHVLTAAGLTSFVGASGGGDTSALQAQIDSLDNRLDTLEGPSGVTQADMDSEITARTNADNFLSGRVTAIENDYATQTALGVESGARAAGDAALDTRLDVLEARVPAADMATQAELDAVNTALDGRLDTLEARVPAADMATQAELDAVATAADARLDTLESSHALVSYDIIEDEVDGWADRPAGAQSVTWIGWTDPTSLMAQYDRFIPVPTPA